MKCTDPHHGNNDTTYAHVCACVYKPLLWFMYKLIIKDTGMLSQATQCLS